ALIFILLIAFCIVGALAGFGAYYYSLGGNIGNADNRQTKGTDAPGHGTTPPKEEPKTDKQPRTESPPKAEEQPEDITKEQDPHHNPVGKPAPLPVAPPLPIVAPGHKPVEHGWITLQPTAAQTAKRGGRVSLNDRVVREDCKGEVRIEVAPVNPDTKIKGT